MSKSPILPLAFVAALGISFAPSAKAQVSGNPLAQPGPGASSAIDPFTSAPGMGASGHSGAQKPDSSTNDDANDTGDDTLTRLKTKDSVAGGEMARDEGELTRKIQRREKITKVESTKQLPTSGSDPKFQGSLLRSSVTSIEDVGAKPNANAAAAAATAADADADTDASDESDPRFTTKHLLFTPATHDESKKKESPGTKADSSPSPSPSASASASPSSR